MKDSYSKKEHIERIQTQEKMISEQLVEIDSYKANAEKYKILFDNAADLIAVVDRNGNFLDLNKKFEEESGYNRTEMIGQNVFTCGIVTPSSSEEMIYYLGEMLEGRSWKIIEIEGVRKDGGIVPYELRAVPNRRNGEIIEVHAILRNITERKKAEEELLEHRERLEDFVRERTIEVETANRNLKKSEEKYRTILENIEDGYYEVDLGGNFTFFNESMRRILGYSDKEMEGMNNREFMDEKTAKKVFNTFNTVYQTGKSSKNFDWELIKKSGDICYIETSISLVRDADKEPVGFRGVARDVSEKKEAEEALKKSEEKYRTILESIEDGYFEVDLSGNFIFFNESLCKIVELSAQELMGMNYRQYTSKETAENVFKTFHEVYRTGKPVNVVDYEVTRKKGDTVVLAFSVSLMKDREENPVGFRGIVRDISERRKAEEEKRKLEAQLNQAQKMESVGTLAGGIAHDFNNLLMSIQGKISVMLFHMKPDHEYYRKLRDIEGYIQNGADLTRQLLGFARGGKYEVKSSDINELLDNTSRMFTSTKKEISIHKNYAKDLLHVEVDQGQMNQVFLNLYVNAWQAMPYGGDLYLETANIHLDAKMAGMYQVSPGNYVKVSITDNGVGMNNETLKRIFDPFFTTREVGVGTGLGLASAYGIIQNHNGAITVYSEEGKGTTFNIYLPMSKISEQKQKAQEQDIVIKGTGTILFVDDETRVIESVEEMLKELGYEVLSAKNGTEALAMVKSHPAIDLAVIDMIMPGMDGSRLFEEMKAIVPDLKVLLASGYSKNKHTENILQMGCNGFIQKPFTLQQLSQTIRMVLDTEDLTGRKNGF